MKYGYYWVALALCLGACPVFAADKGDDDGVTMTIIEDSGETAERDFVQDIELPEAARGDRGRRGGRDRGGSVADEARKNVERGSDQASEARQQGREDAGNRPDGAGSNGGNGQGNLPPDVGSP